MGLWMLGWMLGQGGGEPPIAPWRMVEMHSLSSAAVPDGPRVFVDTRGVWVDGVQVVEGPLTPGSDLSGLDGLKQASVSASGALPVGLLQPVMQRLEGAGLVVSGDSGEAVTPWPLHQGSVKQGVRLVLGQNEVLILHGTERSSLVCAGPCSGAASRTQLLAYVGSLAEAPLILQLVVGPEDALGVVQPWLELWPADTRLSVRLRRADEEARHPGAALSQREKAFNQLSELAPCPGDLDAVLLRVDQLGIVSQEGGGASRQERCVKAGLASLSVPALSRSEGDWLLVHRLKSSEAPSSSLILQEGVAVERAALSPSGHAVLLVPTGTDLAKVAQLGTDLVAPKRYRGLIQIDNRWLNVITLAAEGEGVTPDPGVSVTVYISSHGYDAVLPELGEVGFYCEKTPCESVEDYPTAELERVVREAGADWMKWGFQKGAGVPTEVWLRAHSAATRAGVWEHLLWNFSPENGGSGFLWDSSIKHVIMQDNQAISRCYAVELTRDPKLQGELTVAFEIAPDGSVAGAEVRESDFGESELHGCMTRIFEKMQFAPPLGPLTVVYPFVFSPAEAP